MEDNEITSEDIFYNDCFTEVDEGVNAEFNKVTIKCFDSINNNFSMDCDGNLVVNSIVSKEGNILDDSTKTSIVDFIYPVGSFYININSTNPSLLFGGTWEQINGKFLLGCDDTYVAGSTGGEATHLLTIDELPSHNHGLTQGNETYETVYIATGSEVVWSTPSSGSGYGFGAKYGTSTSTGGSIAHNNMPPYLSVYIWKRVS